MPLFWQTSPSTPRRTRRFITANGGRKAWPLRLSPLTTGRELHRLDAKAEGLWRGAPASRCRCPMTKRRPNAATMIFLFPPTRPHPPRTRLIRSDRKPATRSAASISIPQRPSPAFFRHRPEGRLCSARQKSRRRPPSTLFRPPKGCGPIVPGLSTIIEIAMGAVRSAEGKS